MDFILKIVYFCLVMGIIVFIHELGHFIAAKSFGVYCNEFALGMGPRLFKYKHPSWETTFSIRALPLGGFVSMAGEPGEGDYGVMRERTIAGIAPWKRLIVMLAGIAMNFVLAFVIFWGIFATQGVVEAPPAVIAKVQENSPADKAGLLANDRIVSITFFDGKKINPTDFNDLMTGVAVYEGNPLTLTVDRNGTLIDVSLTPEKVQNENRYAMGIYPNQATVRDAGFIESAGLAITQIGFFVSQLAFILKRLVRGIGLNSVGGPIGIFEVTSEVATFGIVYFWQLVAILSVNLGVINLLPIPVMDGGRALITLIEMVIGRPLPEKVENFIMTVGLAMIVALFIFIMFNDIRKLVG